jgi:hypothetical protein
MSEREFVEKPLPALRRAQLSETVTDVGGIGQVIGPMFERLGARLSAAGVPRLQPAVAWDDIPPDGSFTVVVAAGWQAGAASLPVEDVEVRDLPAYDRAITVLHHGDMSSIGASWQALMRYVEEQGGRPSGPCREIYLETPMDDPAAWVTELQQPVDPLS